MFTQDPFGLPLNPADLIWAYLPSEPVSSRRDDEALLEDWADAAQDE